MPQQNIFQLTVSCLLCLYLVSPASQHYICMYSIWSLLTDSRRSLIATIKPIHNTTDPASCCLQLAVFSPILKAFTKHMWSVVVHRGIDICIIIAKVLRNKPTLTGRQGSKQLLFVPPCRVTLGFPATTLSYS